MDSEFLLTQEQRQYRDRALVYNLRFRFSESVAQYSDAELVKSYDDWFMSAEPDETDDDFFAWLTR